MEPYLIELKNIGSHDEGFLSVITDVNIDFKIKRVFWTVMTPQHVIRGRHAHHNTSMILIAANGSIKVTTISKSNTESEFNLSNSNIGLYIPKLCWHEMEYSKDAVQIVVTNTDYNEKDYIRNKDEFYQIIKGS